MVDPNDLPRDPELTRAIRGALREEKAPEAWVRDALAIPRSMPVPPRESRLLLVLPHFCGGALLLGLAVAFLLRPELLDWTGSLELPLPEGRPGLFLLSPLLMALIAEAAQGFPRLRRWLLRGL